MTGERGPGAYVTLGYEIRRAEHRGSCVVMRGVRHFHSLTDDLPCKELALSLSHETRILVRLVELVDVVILHKGMECCGSLGCWYVLV